AKQPGLWARLFYVKPSDTLDVFSLLVDRAAVGIQLIREDLRLCIVGILAARMKHRQSHDEVAFAARQIEAVRIVIDDIFVGLVVVRRETRGTRQGERERASSHQQTYSVHVILVSGRKKSSPPVSVRSRGMTMLIGRPIQLLHQPQLGGFVAFGGR